MKNTGPTIKFDIPRLDDYNTGSTIDNLVKAYVDTVAKYIEVLSAIQVTADHIGDLYFRNEEIKSRLNEILEKHTK